MTELDVASSLQTMSASEFVCRLREFQGQPDIHYVFWLGAGCSVTSGIPAASSLVRDHWLPLLHTRRRVVDSSVEEWARNEFPGYEPDSAGAFYGPVMEALFRTPDERQRETERLCDGQSPSFGYGVLAALMSLPDGIFSAALTTNFDDLVADAMYVFSTKRPLVIQHESLAGFARPGRVQRPLLVKIHGDHRLNPMHTKTETAELTKSIAAGMHGLLQDRGVIFLGYSGNDRGVIEALRELPVGALPRGVWWVSSEEPSGLIRDWLESRDAIWVKADDFDQLMLLLRNEFEIEHPTSQRFERMFSTYRETYERLEMLIEHRSDTEADSRSLKEAAAKANTEAPAWWGTYLEARRWEDSEPDKADEVYRHGIEADPDARLIVAYAIFLCEKRHDFAKAEEFFERAIALDPLGPESLGNYAWFLYFKRRELDRAQDLMERAYAADPDNATNLSNYAIFLRNERGEINRAEELHQRAVEIDPNDASILRAYAFFLDHMRDEEERAEQIYQRAVGLDTAGGGSLAAYALFLEDRGREPGRVKELYERALALEPNDADILGNYARFLLSVGDDERGAEVIERAFQNAAGEGSDGLRAELWTYRLLCGAPVDRGEALAQLAKLIEAGTRSRGWRFDDLVARAREKDVPDVLWLEKLTDVVAARLDADVLSDWDAWPIRR